MDRKLLEQLKDELSKQESLNEYNIEQSIRKIIPNGALMDKILQDILYLNIRETDKIIAYLSDIFNLDTTKNHLVVIFDDVNQNIAEMKAQSMILEGWKNVDLIAWENDINATENLMMKTSTANEVILLIDNPIIYGICATLALMSNKKVKVYADLTKHTLVVFNNVRNL